MIGVLIMGVAMQPAVLKNGFSLEIFFSLAGTNSSSSETSVK